MPRRVPGPGRPGKGPRKPFMTRMRQPLAEQVVSAADAADVSYSEYIEALVEIGMRHRDELPVEMKAKEVLPEAG